MVVKPGFELGLTKSKVVLCWDVGSCDDLYTIDLVQHFPLKQMQC